MRAKTNSLWKPGTSFPGFTAGSRYRHLEFLIQPPDWLKFVAAILDLENNRVVCSRNNSLLSFSAPAPISVV